MGKVAFLFSGQGDQYPGMGKTLNETCPAAASVFAMCDWIRPGTSDQCFSGTEEELKRTANTQPSLFAMELAAASALMDAGIQPDALAGFSLGEVTAAAVSGMVSRDTGFRLVCRRGELMQREAEKFDTAMAAVVKLEPEQVETLCGGFDGIYPVNYNCPGQITVSGLAEQMPAFSAAVKQAGGRAIPLKVKGAFHSPFMAKAAEDFRRVLDQADFGERKIPLYSNITGNLYSGDARDLLSRQIASPVRWEAIIRNMIADGVDTFVEIGPGRTLTNMVKKIDVQVKACTYDEYLKEAAGC